MKRRQFLVYLGVGTFSISTSFVSAAIFDSARRGCLDQLAPGEKFKSVEALWRPAMGKSQLMALRANAPHYWAWSKVNAKKFFKKDILDLEGVVVGDPHLRNFNVVWLGEELSPWRVVDLDDGGMGSLILDFAMLMHRSKLSSSSLKANDMWKAYIQGLKGKEHDQPLVLQEAYNVGANKFSKKEAKKVGKWLTEDDKINFDKKDELTPIENLKDQLGGVKSRSYSLDRDYLEADLRSDGYKIIDVAYKEKDSGGSQGLPRFVYILEKNNVRTILEFKGLSDPATAEYTLQESQLNRFSSLVKVYWPTASIGEFKVVKAAGGRVYLRRPKQPLLFEIDDKPKKAKDIEIFNLMAIYTANFLGLAHGAQESGQALLRSISNEDKKVSLLSSVKGYIGAYDAEVIKLRNKNGETKK